MFYLVAVVELQGQLLLSKCVRVCVHTYADLCIIKLCSLFDFGTVCSVHFTPVCFR